MFNNSRLESVEVRLLGLEKAVLTLLKAEVERSNKKMGRPVGSKNTKPRKMHKKHMHKLTCDICGRECKGKMGLGVHKAIKHDVHPQKVEQSAPFVFTV